jgi:hypothetical protein
MLILADPQSAADYRSRIQLLIFALESHRARPERTDAEIRRLTGQIRDLYAQIRVLLREMRRG